MIYLILLLGFGLRLISLNQSFWLDETIQVWASKLSWNDFWIEFLPKDFNPPLYYLITRWWIRLFGDGELAVRMTSVLMGVGVIFLTWKIAKRVSRNINNVTIVGLLVGSGPLLIYYSQEARAYMLATFTVLLTTLLFINYLSKENWLNSILLGLGVVLMLMSHYLTILILPVFIGFLIFKKGFDKTMMAVTLILVIFGISYLPIFRSQLKVGTGVESTAPVWSKVIGQANLKSGLLLPVKFVIGRISFQPQWLYGVIAFILMSIFWGSALLSLKENFKYKWLFFGLLAFPPTIGFLISFWLPVFSYFRFVFCLPFLYLLIGLSPINDKLKYFLVIINLILSGIYLFNPQFYRENWKELARWLNEQETPPVYVINQVKFPLEHYYDGKINKITPKQRFIDESMNRYRVYLVSYGLPIFDPEDKIRQELKIMNYDLRRGESFRQVGIEVWEK